MFDKIKNMAKKHTFNFVIICLLTAGITIDAIQSGAIIAFNKSLENHKAEMHNALDIHKKELAQEFATKSDTIDKTIGNFNLALNARIDTIDSTIDVAEKRKALIQNIRNAIKENTETKIDIRTLNKIANAVIDYSYEFNLPIAMVLAQIKQESNFKVNVQSHAKAKGLMQIIDSTADEIAGKLGCHSYNIYDIRTNVRFGCFYMSEMLTQFNNKYEDALRAYNFGPHRVLEVKLDGRDYSRSKIVIENDTEVQYLLDKYGNFETDDDGNKIVVQEEHRYPRETRWYVKLNKKYRKIFSTYGLDHSE